MKKRVLIVDDNASIRKSLQKLLEESGYEVLLAADGEEAEASLVKQCVDLLLLDLEMPRRNGWDVLDSVITCTRLSLVPVIVITGLGEQLDTKTIPGLDALLEKPIDVSVLLKKMADLLAETAEQRLQRLSRERGAGPGYLALPLAGRLSQH